MQTGLLRIRRDHRTNRGVRTQRSDILTDSTGARPTIGYPTITLAVSRPSKEATWPLLNHVFGPSGSSWPAASASASASTPPSSSQDRREDDPRAHARPVRRRTGDRRDHRADGARLHRGRRSGSSRARRLPEGHQGPRGRRDPQRDHLAARCEALGPQECNVLLHDAVRPLLEPRIITRVRRGAGRPTRPSTWRSRAPTRSWWPPTDRDGEIITRHPRPLHGCAAARPRSASGSR